MDITKSKDKLFSNKLFNDETIGYWSVYLICTFIFLFIKQIFKLIFGLAAPIAFAIGIAVAAISMFIVEKKHIFNKEVKSKNLLQILFYIVRCGVDFGFYKICEFVFVYLIGTNKDIIYYLSFVIFGFFNYYFDKLIVFNSSNKATNQKDSKLYKLFFNNRFVLLSSGVSIIVFCFVYVVLQMYPFGDSTVMRMDLYHQYGPLFVEFYDLITAKGHSLLYSWESGGGSSFLGNYFNYLSSPFSIIIFLFDRKNIALAITTLVAVKNIFASASFTYYLKVSQKSHSYATAAFGAMYAFCGYFLAYYWNIMWIDGMVLLPIIVLGIERIINKGKPMLYILSLAILLFSNYYIGFMVCIFSVLYFICYYLSKYTFVDKINFVQTKNKYKKPNLFIKAINNRFINHGFVFAVASIFAGCLCAFSLIPVYFILQSCSATSDTFPSTVESLFNLLDMISSHIAMNVTTIRSSGDDVLPNVYSGLLTAILIPLYVMNKEVKLKEKAMYLIMALFLVLSFNINMLNFGWHAFHYPNDLPYRFSFMYSFIIIVMAFKALEKIKALRYQDIALIGMIWIGIVLFYQKFPTNKIEDRTIYVSIAFIIIWTAVLLMINKKYLNKLVLGVTILSIAFCELIIVDSVSYDYSVTNSDYIVSYDDYRDSVNYIKNNDDSLHREELSYLETRMDPCLYGYNGMSIFSSMAYEDYSQTQYSLGMFGNRINSYTYNTQTPVYNMFYSIKYLIQTSSSTEPSESYYTKLYNSKKGNSEVYLNNYYLPFAFEASSDIKDWNTTEGNPFDVQEDLIDKACGVSNVFVPVKYIDSYGTDVDVDNVTENGTFFYTKSSEESYGDIQIEIETQQEGNLYVYITSPKIENVNYSWDDNNKSKFQSISEPYILDLGEFKQGETASINLDLNGTTGDNSYFEIYAYTVNKDVLNSAFDMLNTGAMDITSYSSTKIEGTIKAGYDGFIYTSIPYDEGWSIYIDGQKQKTFDIGNSQLASTIKQGEHKVMLKYSPKGLKLGLAITATSWIIAGLWLVFYKKFNKRSNFVDNSQKL